MTCARRSAAPTMMAVLAAGALLAPWAAHAQAIDSTGGASAPKASAVARSVSAVDAARAGGVAAPVGGAALVHGSHGAHPPATKGTGGSEYKAVSPKPPSAPRKPTPPVPPKPAPRKPPAEGAVFPVRGPHSFGGPESRFGAGRAGHVHQGQDVLAAEGLPNVAPLAGTIITTGYQAAGAGWYVAEHTAGTFDFFFAHCQAGSLAVRTGQAVAAGQTLCRVGRTGDATGPHLHFEMWVGGWRAPGGRPIDPLPYLEAWEAAGR